jgi:hypothetical protein
VILQAGGQERVLGETTTGPGYTSREGSIKSDSLLATLWVGSLTGSLQVTVLTLTQEGREVELFSFPLVVAGTTNLLLRKSGVSLQRFKVLATYSGVATYEVYIRAVEGAGESSVKIVSSGSLVTSALSISTTPSILIASSLGDRTGITIKNYSGGGTLFISESLAKLPAQAWPLGVGEVWSLDIQAGVTLYGVSSSGIINVRVAEAGGQ